MALLLLFGAVVLWLMWALPWVGPVFYFISWLLALTLITILAVAILFYLISWVWHKRWRTCFSSTITQVSKVDKTTLVNTVCPCVERALEDAYKNQPDQVFRYVDRYWFEGGVFGWVDDKEDKVLYVTFRGTSEIGNWLLTNAQAHMVKAENVFKPGSTAEGGVHQGFVKAYRDLCYDYSSESAKPPPKSSSIFERASHWLRAWRTYLKNERWEAVASYKVTRWGLAPLWTLFLAVPILAALYLARESCLAFVGPPSAFSQWEYWYLLLLACGLLLVVQLLFASGLLEVFFHRKNKLFLGPPLLGVVQKKAAEKEKIVFTGHSLGGALATLAFVDYLTQARGDKELELVTFGAPQVGNDTFAKWLQGLHDKRGGVRTSVHIVGGVGDPVPHLPPRKSFLKVAIENPTLIGAVLAAVYVVGWLPYALCYRAFLGSGWNSLVRWIGSPERGLDILNHSLTYTDLNKKTRSLSTESRRE